ncbi:MAG: carboxypeptidase-like regulatory domain-containing protein [Actinomycetota bacterium]|nr:carboxypeptidase-like regulatory domain-containing protein [Actinomycetota bacterium]
MRSGNLAGRHRSTAAARAAMAAVAVAALAACSSGEVEGLPPPPTTRPLDSTTTTTPHDYTAVELAGVGGRTTTTVSLGPGPAQLSGTVLGPDGPVAGAVVHVERLVGDAVAGAGVTTGPDGRWVLPGVLGGRYRVRAWRVPDLALVEPEVLFVEAAQAPQVHLVVSRFNDVSAASALAPDPPTVNQPANLAFRASQRMVGDGGVVRTVPSAGVWARLADTGQWAVLSPNPVLTDASGLAEWNVVCLTPGAQPNTVTLGEAQLTLTLPPCLPAPGG